jgi:hypothetical protein
MPYSPRSIARPSRALTSIPTPMSTPMSTLLCTFMFIALLTLMCTLPALAGAQAGSASFGGTILSDEGEKPLRNAEVTFTKLGLTTRSDSAGNFVISGVPAGRHDVSFKLVGFDPITTTLDFLPGQKVEGDFLMKALTAKLASVDVKAASTAGMTPAMIEFEGRRKRGRGKFLTQELFEKSSNRLLSDVLTRSLPGIHANALGASGRAMASGRSTVSISTETDQSSRLDKFDRAQGIKEDCYLQVLVDGIVMYQAVPGRPLFDVNTVTTSSISGVEFYQTSQTPPQFQATGSQCGTIIIWTRSR